MPGDISSLCPTSVPVPARVAGGISSTCLVPPTEGRTRQGLTLKKTLTTTKSEFRYATSMGYFIRKVCMLVHGVSKRPCPLGRLPVGIRPANRSQKVLAYLRWETKSLPVSVLRTTQLGVRRGPVSWSCESRSCICGNRNQASNKLFNSYWAVS